MAISLGAWPTSVQSWIGQHQFLAFFLVSVLFHIGVLITKVHHVALPPHRDKVFLEAILQPARKLDTTSNSTKGFVTANAQVLAGAEASLSKPAFPVSQSIPPEKQRSIPRSLQPKAASNGAQHKSRSAQPKAKARSPITKADSGTEIPAAVTRSESATDSNSQLSQQFENSSAVDEKPGPAKESDTAPTEPPTQTLATSRDVVELTTSPENHSDEAKDSILSQPIPSQAEIAVDQPRDSDHINFPSELNSDLSSVAGEVVYPPALSELMAALPQSEFSFANIEPSAQFDAIPVTQSDGATSPTDALTTPHEAANADAKESPEDANNNQNNAAPEIALANVPQAALMSPLSSPLSRLATLPKSVQIVFAAEKNARQMGSAEMRLAWRRDGERYRVSAESIRAGSMANSGDRRVESIGQITVNGLRPQIYVEERMVDGRRLDRTEFDYVANTVRYTSSGRTAAAVVEESSSRTIADMMTMLFQFVIDAPTSGGLADTVPGRQAIERLGYEVVGNETMMIGDLSLETIHMRPRSARGGRSVEIWLASSNHHLPVKLRITELGRVTEQVAINLHVEANSP